MGLARVTAGRDLPRDFNVIVEIPANSAPIKYEVDKESGALFVDRFVGTAMHYPCNYGYIPQTIADDVPADVLDQIRHFFEHYKDLEPGKWVKVKGWKSPEEAEKLIMEGVHGYESMEVKPKTA